MAYDSDSSDGSDFSGFGPEDLGSDVEIPLVHDELSSDDDSNDDSSESVRNDEWTSNFTTPRIDDFVERPGPNLPEGFDTETATPLDYFWLMFPVRLIAMIVRYTNQYASWKQTRTGPDTYWEDVTEPELRAFLSINILMGIHQLPQVEMYWSTNQYVGNQGIQKTMTCNRFIKISQYFQF
ncbi:uncharacterized protein LOC132733266 isoform X2 [Ruditapes philippinarum]|uniref:uncharacterized protein LOC132733266 isoform X2 n=1 Tax=Ruditapes philippinarum TaxID=129788 RepID=UPI00295ACD16|nr:uncharacterized protein LOC132733266 isoform X2 [Ruditapes philippinarum]